MYNNSGRIIMFITGKQIFKLIIIFLIINSFASCVSTKGLYEKGAPKDGQSILFFTIKNTFIGNFDGKGVWWDADIIIPSGIHTLETTYYEELGSGQIGNEPFFNSKGELITPTVVGYHRVFDITNTFDFESGKSYKIKIKNREIIIEESKPGGFKTKRVGNSYISPDLVWPQFELGWTFSNTVAAGGSIKAGLSIVNNKIFMKIDTVAGMGVGLYFHNIDIDRSLTADEKSEPISMALPYYFGLMTDFYIDKVVLGIGGGAAGMIRAFSPAKANPQKVGISPFIQGTFNFYHRISDRQRVGSGFYLRYYPMARNIPGSFGAGYLMKFN